MIDTSSRVPRVELVARASISATEHAKYNVLRHKLRTSDLGQFASAIQASTVVTLSGVAFLFKFRNQGALEEWRCLFTAHDWSRRVWGDWASARATCLDCINELCWQVGQQYGHIMGGPAIMPALGAAGIRSPHWRRGHFRAQPCAPPTVHSS